MRAWRGGLAVAWALLSHCAAAWAAGPLAYVPLDDQWEYESRGAWQQRRDVRALLAQAHPWEPSEAGGYAQASRMVDVPGDWSGPVFLSLYCSDDYHTDSWRPDGGTATAEGFIGHRFKQIFVNGEIVWSQDVADAVMKGASPMVRIPLKVRAGERFRLGLVTFDRVASTQVLPQDFFQASDGGTSRERQEHAVRFMTHVYWGDIALCEGDSEAPRGRRPSEELVASVHEKRWPLAPPVIPDVLPQTVTLAPALSTPLPRGGFPVRMGIPFPPGKVASSEKFALRNAAGEAIAASKRATAAWPDGSLQWCAVDFIAPADAREIQLHFRQDTAKPATPARVREVAEETETIVETGMQISAAPGRLLYALRHGRELLSPEVELVVRAGAERVTAVSEHVRVVERGPVLAELVLEGELQGAGNRLGRFELQVQAWTGATVMRWRLRIFNDTEKPLALTSVALGIQLSGEIGAARFPGAEAAGDFSVQQPTPEVRTLHTAEGQSTLDARAPFYVDAGPVVVAMPRMRERFPQGVARAGARLQLRVVDAGERPIVLTPGEALGHEVWLKAGGKEKDAGEMEAFAAAASRPPAYANGDYYCATGALGPAWGLGGVEKFARDLAGYQGRDWEALGQRLGQRDFPDAPYLGQAGSWTNNYYDRLSGAWCAWLLTGDAEWRTRALDLTRLVLDVAFIQSEVPGRDWLGALHGPGSNHVPGPWAPTLRTRGLRLGELLAGDADAGEAALAVADFCARTGAGLGRGTPRQHAGPMDAIVNAYEATGDPAWLDEGSKRLEAVWENMDRRRGVWPDEHGSRVYRGNIPWMAAQLAGALYDWYRLTGDVEAAQAVVALAESMVCENVPWDRPGEMRAYSHNPHLPGDAAYDPFIMPVLLAAHELTEQPHFREAAMAQWERWQRSDAAGSVFSAWWHTPWLGWYLRGATGQ